MSNAKSPFSPAMFRFLNELRDNNNRQWFNDNKERYLTEVRDPMLRFIMTMQVPLAEISAHILADPKPVGGSMFRIYRDTRFAKDKTPYKTHVACHFRHRDSGDAHSLGFYMHAGPEGNFFGGGIWHPPTQTAHTIRNAIASRPDEWRAATQGKEFLKATKGVVGEQLKRVPREYDPEHTFADDLRRKDFTASSQLTNQQVTAPGFLDNATEAYKSMAPLMSFLAQALKLEW